MNLLFNPLHKPKHSKVGKYPSGKYDLMCSDNFFCTKYTSSLLTSRSQTLLRLLLVYHTTTFTLSNKNRTLNLFVVDGISGSAPLIKVATFFSV